MSPDIRRLVPTVVLAIALPYAAAAGNNATDVPRTADGRPDLTGTYDTATLTPLSRDPRHGDNLYLTPEEAERIAKEEASYLANRNEATDPDREAPPEGGDGSTGASGNVGGYNAFWIDRGSEAILIGGKFRTSILYDPPNGRTPPRVGDGANRDAAAFRFRSLGNTGRADWIVATGEEPGPYDNPEQRGVAERCILGFGSTAGPPMLPALYNNHKRIVQTEDHVVILVEMNHDARIVRLDSEHAPAEVRSLLGDSIGWWEGDTLVVETTNFMDVTSFRGGSENMRVVERFTPSADGSLVYNFTVEDPTVWTTSFSGEYPWPRTDEKVFEYACAEGNYALGNILRGARLLEAEAIEALKGKKQGD
jgi:hypothetical protein